MLEALIVVLLVCWLLGLFAFKVSSSLIHVLLIVALVIIVIRALQGRNL